MSRNIALLDIYFHMANHYKKLKSVKSVVDTSPPTGYDKTQCIGRSRPTSRSESRASSARLTATNSSDRFYISLAAFKQNGTNVCPSTRSLSLPSRPTTRRKPIDMPYMYQISTSNRRRTTPKKSKLTNDNSPKLAASQEIACDNDAKKPTAAPRKKVDKKCEASHKKKVSEHEYLRFSLRIMEDIIRNNLHTNKQMREVFKSHIEANYGCLNTERMLQQIHFLQLELGIPNSENDDDSQEDVKQPPCVQRSIVQQSNSHLNCECAVIRQLPYSCQFIEVKSEEAEYESLCIEQLILEEKVISRAELDQSSSRSATEIQPCLSSVLEQTEPTSSIEILTTNKISACNSDEGDLANKDALEIINKEIVSIPNVANVIVNNFAMVEQPVQLNDLYKNDMELVLQTSQDLVESKEEVQNKALVVTESASFILNDPADITNDYILIPGPIYIPKVYLNSTVTNELRNMSIEMPTKSEKYRYLLITKNIGVNTDLLDCSKSSMPRDSKTNSLDKSEKNLSEDMCDMISQEPDDWLNIASVVGVNRLTSVDLNCYDLTPQRDSNVSSHSKLKDNLLLGDQYEIKKELSIDEYCSGLPLSISQYYPSDATQTLSSDWLIPRKSTKSGLNLAKPRDSVIKTDITPPDNCLLSVNSFIGSTLNRPLRENSSIDPANLGVVQSLRSVSEGSSTRKSSLKKRLNPSVDSGEIGIHPDTQNRATFSEESLLENERLKLQYRHQSTRSSTIQKVSEIHRSSDKIDKNENIVKEKKAAPSFTGQDSEEELERQTIGTESSWDMLLTIKNVADRWDELRNSEESEKIQQFNTLQDPNTNECQQENNDTNSDLESSCGIVKTRRKRPHPADTTENKHDAVGTVPHVNGKAKEININSARFF